MKDADGNVVEVHCTYDPASRGGNSPDGRKVKSTMHWVSAAHAIERRGAALRQALLQARPRTTFRKAADLLDNLNPNSLEVIADAKLEPSLAQAKAGDRYQFERVGYFCLRPRFDSRQAGLQPDAAAERFVGEDRKESRGLATLEVRRSIV